MSYLLGIPIEIKNIRKKRDNPGLQRQHLTCTKFITSLYNTKDVSGLQLNSGEINLIPSELIIKQENSNEIKCILNSAGSIGLMIQQLLPCALYSEIENKENNKLSITLTGGTLVKFSPTIYYLNEVLFPILEKYMNIKAKCDLIKNGIYPMGLGEVILHVQKILKNNEEFIKPINITERGKFLKAEIRFCYTNNFKFKLDKICDTIYNTARDTCIFNFMNYAAILGLDSYPTVSDVIAAYKKMVTLHQYSLSAVISMTMHSYDDYKNIIRQIRNSATEELNIDFQAKLDELAKETMNDIKKDNSYTNENIGSLIARIKMRLISDLSQVIGAMGIENKKARFYQLNGIRNLLHSAKRMDAVLAKINDKDYIESMMRKRMQV